MNATQERKPVTMTSETLAARAFKYVALQHPFASNRELKEIAGKYMRRMIETGMIIIEG